MRILVQLLGSVGERLVDLDHFARNRRVDIRHGFHGLDRAERSALLDACADLRQIDVDDIAEFLLRVIGDADGADVAFDRDPLVFLRVPKVFWIHVLISLVCRKEFPRSPHPPAGCGS